MIGRAEIWSIGKERMSPRSRLSEKWDKEADVVVVGFGGAGAAAAITAQDAGSSVLLLEKAPKGQEGGNTKVAGQGYLNATPTDEAMEYFNALCGPFPVDQEVVQAWGEEIGQNNDWLTSIGGDPQEHQHPPLGIEFPELPGSQSTHKFHEGPIVGFSNTWLLFQRVVNEREIEVWYESPATELVQRDGAGEIVGVKVDQGGRQVYVKAKRAVILTCGGFENNQEMIRNYLPGLPYCYTNGSPYNEGDGVRMAMEVGADLWHMNNFAGPSMALKVPEYRTTFSMIPLHFSREMPGGMIVVGPDANRFADEKRKTSHGKVLQHGRWGPTPTPCPMHMIVDDTLVSSGPIYDKEPRSGWNTMVDKYDWSDDNSAEVARGWIKKGDTIGELASAIGLDGPTLEKTVAKWNSHCEKGEDTDFGRTLMFAPLDKAPFYALELSPSMLNTQGGPRRNGKAQVVRPDGTPLPRLYSAGELGSMYSYLYQGTGNIGECLVFGRISGRNAAAEQPWE
ncbi:MAG: FAD-binding dehydrogenase [Chloroflexi bacterium]|nr:FAD-binding dehydrogenase [Chloroflexota bacterium]